MKRIFLFVIFMASAFLSAQQLYINEFMADNDNTIPDEQGDYDDWLEIYNPNTEAVDLGGFFLSDNEDELDKYEIPTDAPDLTTIPAGGFIIIWCDDDSDDGPLHTNFKLSADGEALFLTEWNAAIITDSYLFGTQTTDVSEGRITDGADDWQFFTLPTPGTSNGSENQPPLITGWQQLDLSPAANQIVQIIATVTDDNTLNEVIINYDAGSGWQITSMFDDGNHNDGVAGDNLFGGTIPGFEQGTQVGYYIEAIDDDNLSSLFPVNAPDLLIEYENGWQHPQLCINEFMASNDTTITDPQGDYEDWIEIFNAGNEAADLGGYWFTDDFSNLSAWYQIPANNPNITTIDPGEFLLLWADEDTDDGILHLDFKLSADGENFGFYAYYATTPVDSITYAPLNTDISQGRLPDGSDIWQLFGNGMENPATPGFSNQPFANDLDQISPPSGTISAIYPNPFINSRFRSAISIDLYCQTCEDLRLAIFNIRGQKISSHSFQNLNSGRNTVSYILPDNLASGVYFMKSIDHSNIAPHKLLLVR